MYNAKRTNNVKIKIRKTQQNSKCRLCGDLDKRINPIISERGKLAQRESTRLGREGDPRPDGELFKKRKFEKLGYAQPGIRPENETYTVL